MTISFNLNPGVSFGDAVEQIPDLTRGLPATISGAFQGTALNCEIQVEPHPPAGNRDSRHLHCARHSLRELYPPADDSFRSPSAVFGALLTLYLFKMSQYLRFRQF